VKVMTLISVFILSRRAMEFVLGIVQGMREHPNDSLDKVCMSAAR
jgi:hypothetical protein